MEIEELSFTIPYGKVAALAWGPKDGYPVLAIHGWLDNAASFSLMAPILVKNNLRLISIDLPGHGFSDHRPDGSYISISDYVVDISILIAQLKVSSIALLGHSLGGAIACLAAGSIPNNISHLILIDSLGPLSIEAEDSPKLMSKAIAQYKHIHTKILPQYKFFEDAIDARLKATPMATSSIKVLLERGLKQDDNKKSYSWRTDPKLMMKSLTSMVEPQVLSFLNNINIPTCLIRPDDGWPFDEDKINNRVKSISELTINHLPGNHHVHMDSPDEIAKIIELFFSSCKNPIL